MIARFRLALKLAWCALFHDLRERQHSFHCYTCWPAKHRYVLTAEAKALLSAAAKDAE